MLMPRFSFSAAALYNEVNVTQFQDNKRKFFPCRNFRGTDINCENLFRETQILHSFFKRRH